MRYCSLGVPRISIEPALFLIWLSIVLSKMDLPAPLGPMMAVVAPFGTSNVMSFKMGLSPSLTDTSFKLMAVSILVLLYSISLLMEAVYLFLCAIIG